MSLITMSFSNQLITPPQFSSSPHSSRYRSSSRSRISASFQMESENRRFMEFPYASTSHRDLMVDLVSTLETRLRSELRPSTLPPEAQYYENQSGTAHGSLHIRSGNSSSPIDFILGSWLHGELPTGELNITSLSASLNSSSDAPNFLFELIRSSPTSMVMILDLPPRKDLILYPDYLETFYEQTQLDKRRQIIEKIPEVCPYVSPSLFIRCVVSPTAILVRINGEAERLEEIVRANLGPVAKEVLGIWLNECACKKREVGESEKSWLEKRDMLVKEKTIEVDLGSSLPRLFGQETGDHIVGIVREIFKS